MRTLAKIGIVILVVLTVAALGLAVAAALDDNIKQMEITFFTAVGGQAYQGAMGIYTQIMTLASANGTNFLIYTIIVGVLSAVVWVAALHPLWEKRPAIMGGNKTGNLPTVREEPRDIIITQSPVPTTQQDKKEVTATESPATS